MSSSKLTTCLTVRTTKILRKEFNKSASKYGDPSSVHRDILQAFVDGRLTITPKPTMEINYNEH